jgi:hypothetical protein
MVFGLLLLATGLYDKVGPPEHADEQERLRQSPAPTPKT